MIRTDFIEGVMRLTLDRPGAANALDSAMQGALATALLQAQEDDAVRAVVLTGNSKIFCAGVDLKEYADLPPHEGRKKRRDALGETLLALIDFDKPLLACVEGRAIGAGCMMALLCDELHVAPGAVFSIPEVRIGIPTPLGVSIAYERAGPRVARWLTLSGKPLSAAAAQAQGVVDELHESAVPLDATLARAREMGSSDLKTFAQTKRWLHQRVRAQVGLAIDETSRIAELLLTKTVDGA